MKQSILYIVHNHPATRPGGAEGYALELYEALRDGDRMEPRFLARTGPPHAPAAHHHEGTRLGLVGSDPSQYLFYTDTADHDAFLLTYRDKSILTRHLRDFLLAYEPSVVHFHHALFWGFDALHEVRNTLPHVPIVYTLHEFIPICHRNGQLLRTVGEELCLEESPRRCHECFPEISPQSFFMRKRFLQSHLALVDLFLAPSHFLRERYIDWGIPPERIRFEEYGRKISESVPSVAKRSRRNRLGFFGQLNQFKGTNVLLRAMKELRGSTVDARLWVYGSNLELATPEFQDEFNRLIEELQEEVVYAGRYDHARLPNLMAEVDWVVVPSLWWENSPLVIQEAFMHGRPVICSDVGGMAEKVDNGVNGLHFPVGNPSALATVIREAVESPGLWDALADRIPPVYSIEEHVSTLIETYDELLAEKRVSASRRPSASTARDRV